MLIKQSQARPHMLTRLTSDLTCMYVFLDALASLKTMLDINSFINVFKISRLKSIREYYSVLQSVTEYNRVLESVTECYRV